jgi:hypothetical protein
MTLYVGANTDKYSKQIETSVCDYDDTELFYNIKKTKLNYEIKKKENEENDENECHKGCNYTEKLEECEECETQNTLEDTLKLRDSIINRIVKNNVKHMLVLTQKKVNKYDIKILLNRISIIVKIIQSGHHNLRTWKCLFKILTYLNAFDDVISLTREFLSYHLDDCDESFDKLINEKTYIEKNVYNIYSKFILQLNNPQVILCDLLIVLLKYFGKTYNEFMTQFKIPSFGTLFISYETLQNRVVAICIPSFKGRNCYLKPEDDEDARLQQFDKECYDAESDCERKFIMTKEKVEIFSCKYDDCLQMSHYLDLFQNTHSIIYLASTGNKKHSDIIELQNRYGLLYFISKKRVFMLNKICLHWALILLDKDKVSKVVQYNCKVNVSNLDKVIKNQNGII